MVETIVKKAADKWPAWLREIKEVVGTAPTWPVWTREIEEAVGPETGKRIVPSKRLDLCALAQILLHHFASDGAQLARRLFGYDADEFALKSHLGHVRATMDDRLYVSAWW